MFLLSLSQCPLSLELKLPHTSFDSLEGVFDLEDVSIGTVYLISVCEASSNVLTYLKTTGC